MVEQEVGPRKTNDCVTNTIARCPFDPPLSLARKHSILMGKGISITSLSTDYVKAGFQSP